jgi:outer membrane biosynthesis protein TonB
MNRKKLSIIIISIILVIASAAGFYMKSAGTQSIDAPPELDNEITSQPEEDSRELIQNSGSIKAEDTGGNWEENKVDTDVEVIEEVENEVEAVEENTSPESLSEQTQNKNDKPVENKQPPKQETKQPPKQETKQPPKQETPPVEKEKPDDNNQNSDGADPTVGRPGSEDRGVVPEELRNGQRDFNWHN